MGNAGFAGVQSNGPTCVEYTVDDTCSSKGTPHVDGTCTCWDSKKGTGPTCSEYSDARTCANNGKANADGTCTCFGSMTGLGPTCSEFSDVLTCNGKGTVAVDCGLYCTQPESAITAVCECFDPALGLGPTCSEFTNSATCNNLGIAQKDGTCLCHSPNIGTGVDNCTTFNNDDVCNGNGDVHPNGFCMCYSSAVGTGPTCVEYSDDATCSGKGTVDVAGNCKCWNSAVGFGPTCVEYSDDATCSGKGTVDVAGNCKCWSSAVGEGPSCSEYTDGTTCSGNGTVASNGYCSCWSSAIGVGPTCSEYSDGMTCNGNGKAQHDGTCICSDPAIGQGLTCSEFNNLDTCSGRGVAQPDGTCICHSPQFGIGADCSGEVSNKATCSDAGTVSVVQQPHKEPHTVLPEAEGDTNDSIIGSSVFRTSAGGTNISFEVCAPCTMNVTVLSTATAAGKCTANTAKWPENTAEHATMNQQCTHLTEGRCAASRQPWLQSHGWQDRICEWIAATSPATANAAFLNLNATVQPTCSNGKWTAPSQEMGDGMNASFVHVGFTMEASDTDDLVFANAQSGWRMTSESVRSPVYRNASYLASATTMAAVDTGSLECSADQPDTREFEPACNKGAECLVGAEAKDGYVYFEICAPCTAEATFAFAPPTAVVYDGVGNAVENEVEYDTAYFSATCAENKWTSSPWTSGNYNWTQRFSVTIPPVSSLQFPLGNLWTPETTGIGAYLIANEEMALKNGKLDCDEIPGQYMTPVPLQATTKAATLPPLSTMPAASTTTTTTTASYECTCWDEAQAGGPTCSERTAEDICNDNGVLSPPFGVSECICSNLDIGRGTRCNDDTDKCMCACGCVCPCPRAILCVCLCLCSCWCD